MEGGAADDDPGEDGDDDTGKRTGQARYEYLWASSWRVSTAWSLPRHQIDSSVDLGVILVKRSLQSSDCRHQGSSGCRLRVGEVCHHQSSDCCSGW